MNHIELVVFDMAGTTVHDDDTVNRCLREALLEAGLAVTRAAVNAVMGLPKPEAIGLLIEESTMRDRLRDRVGAIHQDFVERSVRYYQADSSVREVRGAGRVFEVLKRAGIRVALDTGFDRAITDVILKRLGWLGHSSIDATISSDQVTRGRPHPDMIIALMNRLGVVDPGRVAKVGDTPADLEEGRNAGCGMIVGVIGGTHSRAQLATHPHTHLIETIADLPGLLGLGPIATDGQARPIPT
jgi:phosphonatase-like hydrolase